MDQPALRRVLAEESPAVHPDTDESQTVVDGVFSAEDAAKSKLNVAWGGGPVESPRHDADRRDGDCEYDQHPVLCMSRMTQGDSRNDASGWHGSAKRVSLYNAPPIRDADLGTGTRMTSVAACDPSCLPGDDERHEQRVRGCSSRRSIAASHRRKQRVTVNTLNRPNAIRMQFRPTPRSGDRRSLWLRPPGHIRGRRRS